MLCCPSFQLSLPNEFSGAIYNAIGVMCCQCQYLLITLWIMLYLISVILSSGMQGCHCWCHWYHIMSVLIWIVSQDQKSYWTLFQLSLPKEYNGGIDNGVGIPWCQCQWLHMTKEVTLHLRADEVCMIVLFRKLSWKGFSFVTFANLLGDRTHQANMIVLLRMSH